MVRHQSSASCSTHAGRGKYEAYSWWVCATSEPVVASNISSLPEVMIDGKTGLLFKKGDPEDLAEKIIYLLKNTRLRKRMGYTARQFVIKTFDANKIYDKIESLFKNM